MGILKGGVALVTGAASGIGRASAQAFAREGARAVVVSDIDAEGGEETVQLIQAAGVDAVFVNCDVSKENDVERLIGVAISRYGSVDYAHNNAGAKPHACHLHEITVAEWDRIIDTHLRGVWLCMKHEIRAMLVNKKGAIVNTSSAAGILGGPMMSAYTAAKHGIVGLTKAAAAEYARSGIRINTLCPGHTETPMDQGQPGGLKPGEIERYALPIEQANPTVWLCSDWASYITGATLPVDGGATASL